MEHCVLNVITFVGLYFKVLTFHCCRVIDGSMKNFKAFFRRLYVAILRLSKEVIPPELTKVQSPYPLVYNDITGYYIASCSSGKECSVIKIVYHFQMTQQDINFVAQFLSESFTEVCTF